MPSPPPRSDAADLVAWYSEMGIDVALDEEPVDRFAEPPPKAPPPPDAPRARPVAPPPPGRAPASVPPSDETTREARTTARSAKTLDELRTALDGFEGCNLRLTATQLVFADGTPGSRVMLIGEGPGRDEDIQGLPFVGRSGQLLDRMLKAIGLDRGSVYIANIVPWRPPGNRRPTPQETAVCRPFIERQIELADPDFLVLLGGAAASELLDSPEGILKMRGRWREYDTGKRRIRAMPTLHPAYLLRQPLHKRLAWRDLLALKEAIDAEAAT
ncbi:MAG: uracil-DNA glycosylase [Bauldia sp.]|uniref:uracil-DNA glycosylase n=1 Tax=Bauldia sp. TaxID=2575872 RepID=UPI001D74C820|nr:uracil-DNA glycosylase [Bauldia sp.]MCB1496635.1 uracil-DNA glycosylase [Bauldia sp.]